MEMYPENIIDDESINDELLDVSTLDDGINMMLDNEAEEEEEAEEDLLFGLAEFEREGLLIPDTAVDSESDNTDDIANNENEGE